MIIMNHSNLQEFLKNTGLFWQYPVKTEKEFYDQNMNNDSYFGFPWATIIDKRVDHNQLYSLLKSLAIENSYTCCQHIHFRTIIPLLKKLGITKLFTPHKVLGEDEIDGIVLYPCPLYPVNVEDPNRNKEFQNIDFLKTNRPYLYSFMGGYQPSNYLSEIRKNIYELEDSRNDIFILNTGSWHFNNVVYSNLQNANGDLNINPEHNSKTSIYNDVLLKSKFSLCPSGSGPNSIRFWESLAIGSIPVLLADTLELPKHSNWENTIIRIKESDLNRINSILESISEENIDKMRHNCISMYNLLKNNYKHQYL